MYGRALSCDVCGNIKMVSVEDDIYLVDAAIPGWIRVHANKPLEDNYTYKPQSQSNVVGAVDCCTISCAQKYLRDCAADATEIPKAAQ